jgi:HEAT repeat protein
MVTGRPTLLERFANFNDQWKSKQEVASAVSKLRSSNSEHTRKLAAEKLKDLADSHHAYGGVLYARCKVLIGEYPGAVEGLVELLSSNNSGVQEKAAMALERLAYFCPTNQVRIEKCPGAVAGLVGLLSSSDSDVQRVAVKVLSHLAGKCNKGMVVEYPGAVPSLVGLLSSTNSDVRKDAVLLRAAFNDG